VVARLGGDPRTRHSRFFRRYRFTSYLGVPLIARDEVLGVLSIYTTREHSFETGEVEFLTTIAAQAAIAIRNSQLYEETANANRIKEEFLSVMSHELRTPLNVVMGYAALLRDGVLGAVNAEQEDALEKILQRAADQLAMINNIMQTSMLETRAGPVRREQVNVAGLLAEIGSDLRAHSQKKGVEFVWECLTGPLVMITDGGKLKQILVNLVNNAFKFTHEGRVAVSAGLAPAGPWEENGGRWMEFKVADTGIGIPKEKLPAIFDKFYQVDASDTRPYGGVGLGLYIVKKLAELLGGDVEVETETGGGSTFTVRLPLGEHPSLPLRGAA
jgi:signal transduction histidine kinase